MALKPCKECGKPLSTKAKACPHCGAEREPETSAVTLGCAVMLGAGALMAVVVNGVGSCQADRASEERAQQDQLKSPEQRALEAAAQQRAAEKKAENERLTSAVYACRTTIRKRLKDPDSAQWAETGDKTPAEKTARGTYVVQPALRAKNSFGALVLERYHCELRHLDGDNWSVLAITAIN